MSVLVEFLFSYGSASNIAMVYTDSWQRTWRMYRASLLGAAHSTLEENARMSGAGIARENGAGGRRVAANVPRQQTDRSSISSGRKT